MFNYSAFIRITSDAMRKRVTRGLQERGYEETMYDGAPIGHFIFTNINGWYSDAERVSDGLYDCGTDERSFLAIAAINDETDKFQWFTDGNIFISCMDKLWYDGKQRHRWYKVDEYCTRAINVEDFTKATPEQLVKYFSEHPEPRTPEWVVKNFHPDFQEEEDKRLPENETYSKMIERLFPEALMNMLKDQHEKSCRAQRKMVCSAVHSLTYKYDGSRFIAELAPTILNAPLADFNDTITK